VTEAGGRRQEAGGRRPDEGGRGKERGKTTLSYLIFNHVTIVCLFQVWPSFENVTVNNSIDWQEQIRVGNFYVFEFIGPCFFC